MTAINIFRQRYRAAILTDGAGYDTEGVLQGLYAKCSAIPHLRAAVATRGTAVTTSLFAGNFGLEFATFDEMIEGVGEFAKDLFETSGDLFYSGETAVQCFIAGWSESRNRPETYFFVSSDDQGQGFDPWHVYECDPAYAAPVPSEQELEAHGVDITKRPDDVDPVSDGIRILQAQRAMKLPTLASGDGPLVHIVGGFALLTEIKQDGVFQRVIHRWKEDKIGELIDPAPVEMNAPRCLTEAPMNRQQRRAMEREMRKRGRVAA